MAKTAQQIVQKWQQGMAQAGPAYAQGTGAVQQSPMAAAAAKASLALQNYSNAINSGQWAAKLTATPISYWKSQCAGASAKLASGATKGTPKYTAAIQNLIPVYAQMKQASEAAGNDPVAKAVAALQVLIAAGKKGKAAAGG
jgi:hypothetical protein